MKGGAAPEACVFKHREKTVALKVVEKPVKPQGPTDMASPVSEGDVAAAFRMAAGRRRE